MKAGRRQLVLDALGASVSAAGFGIIYGLAARKAGFSPIEGLAMSIVVSAGSSQFAAVGLIAAGSSWLVIVGLTALINARHLLYSAAIAPWLAARRPLERLAMAHYLTDETFAVSLAHFRRLGRTDVAAYWIAVAMIPGAWVAATALGVIAGAAIPDPWVMGLDVIFPAMMAGLAVALVASRPELAAAVLGAVIGLLAAVAWGAAVGVVAGGLVGAGIASFVPGSTPDESHRGRNEPVS
ncbi:MAG: AzlC family ABC transporter permease [Chloroflexota bacterium]|nr:AzlC family ABC transporter permease [Chloroflexota bacterium]